MARLGPNQIRALRAETPRARARDFAALHQITEAELVAAFVGHGTTPIVADPDRLVPWVGRLGEVMALTRNEHCVHERRGTYSDYRTGAFASMVLDPEIDLRIFPKHWVHAFAVEEMAEDGPKRSLQVFDAAGHAVHKVHLKPESRHDLWADLLGNMRITARPLDLLPRVPVQPAKGGTSGGQALRAAWDRMTDTHQFLGLVKDQEMNRLGAYRVAGAPYVARLEPEAVTLTLRQAADNGIPVMIFVGNAGCIQIHGGPIEKIVPMGPWINVMDPRFNLHLRADRLAEVYRVWKPTRTGDVFSVEAFAADGELILQVFGYRKNTPAEPWNTLVAGLPMLEQVPA
ncbi:hemin-degrading factor [Tabrizicola aquatica]|uniref:hemin-degrading factor n=1 Tax=Tabrizicola aquatica TaxID=909926 RepID=UPI001FE64B0E|nr:ChuX/HutX family heme-like substrate-binding protein [Tabrizicola aquatica]